MAERLNVGVMFRNNEKFVAPFFFFLRRSTDVPLTIYALDQASTDGTRAEIEKNMDKEHDVYIYTPENKGIAGGRNILINDALSRDGKYKHWFHLDSDLFIVKHHSIEKMLSALERREDCGVIVGKQQSFWGNQKEYVFGISFSLIRDTVMQELKGFDEGFQMFWDDTDFFDRVQKMGLRFHMEEQAFGVHMWGSTTRQGSEGKRRAEVIKHDTEYFEKKWNKKLPGGYD